ncbi:hypothetical protein IF1G_08189 [Cordyceps javanica]|uniref:Uncharacterized protein n=1 Tax=Cordyceps javanica TaxID=43265 RepID=A0A545UTU7_9HYPO|nr:hypothetical protein IF1G_08189 [Cordyceps javanica]TQW04785.1 hypothetical protein IF2G_07428 [Cordyceps javanica]
MNARVAEGKLPPVRALVLNAGFQEHTTQTKTEDGFDMTFQVNYFSQFLLVLLLLQSMDKESGHKLAIGSWLHDPEDRRFDGKAVYPDQYRPLLRDGVEPLAREPNLLILTSRLREMLELQRRLNSDSALRAIQVIVLDPGAMPSNIIRRASFFERIIINYIARNALAPIMT